MDENEEYFCNSELRGATELQLAAILSTLVEDMARRVCKDAVSKSLFVCSIAQALMELQGQEGYDEE